MANNSSISTLAPYIVPDYYWILGGVLAFFTVFGNMVVIVLIVRCPALRTKQNWFVLSLAVADFLVAIGFVLEIIADLEEYKKNYNAAFTICLRIIDFFTYASMTNLCALTLDRHLAITYPLKHRFLKRKSNVIKTLAMAWFVAFLIPFVHVVLELIVGSPQISKGYLIFVLLCFETFPCVALSIAYFHLLLVSRRHRAQIRREANELQYNHATIRHHRNRGTIRVLGGVIGFFVISYVLNIYRAWVYYVAKQPLNQHVKPIAWILVKMNSANNVIVYGLFKKDFRREITKLCCRCIPKRNVSTQARTLPQPREIVNETAL